MSSLASWCDAVRHDVTNARVQPKDHCHLVMSRKKMFTSVANETAEETIGRLGWHGDRATMLASGGQDWWLYYNHARFLRRQGVYIDLATNDAIARNNNFFNDVCLRWKGLCFEPNPLHHDRIRATRSCQLLPTCVSHRTGSKLKFGTGNSNTFGGNAALLVSTSDDPERLQAAWTFLKYITSGLGAAAVAETTGYMPPNKAANEIILADFYKKNPNKETAVRQLPLLREWIAYPGDNGLAVTQVIYDGIESVVVGDQDDMKALQEELQEEVTDLLPAPAKGS